MIRDYTETRYYATVKVQAPAGADPFKILETARELYELIESNNELCDMFQEGLTFAFEGGSFADSFEARISEQHMKNILAEHKPKDWIILV